MLLRFEGVPAPVAFRDCDSLLPRLAPPIATWPHAAWQGKETKPSVILERTADGFRVEAPPSGRSGRDRPPDYAHDYTNDYEAIAGFFAKLYGAYILANPDLICLHAAAVKFEGGLVVLPASGKAGKSTMAVHCAAAGAKLFTDDVLPVRDGVGLGVALGVAPRLRLPLPGNATEGFRAFLGARDVLGDAYGRFVGLRPGEIAAFGETAPIGAIVLLDRKEEGAPSLASIGKSEALRDLVGRNFTRSIGAEERLSRLLRIAGAAPCYRLRYAACEPAIPLLREVG